MIAPVNNIPSVNQLNEDNALSSLKHKSDELRDVAEQFESIFLNFFLAARAATGLKTRYQIQLPKPIEICLTSNMPPAFLVSKICIAEGLMRHLKACGVITMQFYLKLANPD